MTQEVDSLFFTKTLWKLFEGKEKLQLSNNDGGLCITLTKQHFDYVVSQRINHNQFIHQGTVFNLTNETLQLEAEWK